MARHLIINDTDKLITRRHSAISALNLREALAREGKQARVSLDLTQANYVLKVQTYVLQDYRFVTLNENAKCKA